MSHTLELLALPSETVGDAQRLHYALKFPDGNRWNLWYEGIGLTDTMDAPLVGLIQPLMAVAQPGWHLHVNGALSSSLAWHIGEFQAIWSNWGAYQPVTIQADSWEEARPQSEQAIASFSGGVDSAYTAYMGSQTTDRPYPLGALLLIHGFDIPLTDTMAYDEACRQAQPMADSLTLPLFRLKTNLADIHRSVRSWTTSYASAVASCLRLYSHQFTAGIIPSSYPYSGLHFPAGSNPISDPLLSSQHFAIQLHGSSCTRLQKTAALLHWSQFINHMRVCWQTDSGGKNCGQCEKCLRMRLLLALMGVKNVIAFPETPTIDQVLPHLRLYPQDVVEAYERILVLARQQQSPWARVIAQAIWRNRGLNRLRLIKNALIGRFNSHT